jgi:hypothetical protein
MQQLTPLNAAAAASFWIQNSFNFDVTHLTFYSKNRYKKQILKEGFIFAYAT